MSTDTLVVYYSHSGNTEKIARIIHAKVGGMLQALQPVTPYPQVYRAVVDQAKQEIQAGYLPPLLTKMPDLIAYDTLFVGSPNWWSTIAPPVAAFLSAYDMAGKTIVPFFTHGGGGLAGMQKEVIRLCPNASVLSSYTAHAGGGRDVETEIAEWLVGLGLVND